MNKKENRKKGFTLVELLAAIAILAIIAVVSTTVAIKVIDSIKQKSKQVVLENITKSAKMYANEFGDSNWYSKQNDTNEYICIRVQNLIDAGYFKNNEFKDNDNGISPSTKIYVSRNLSTMAINEIKIDNTNLCINYLSNNDTTRPICKFNTPNNVKINNSATVTMSCTDGESGLQSKILNNDNFETKNVNIDSIDNPKTIENGYSYKIKYTGNTLGKDSYIKLKGDILSDEAGNKNQPVSSSKFSVYKEYIVNFIKGSNISTIGNTSLSCTTTETSCEVTLPTITPNNGYTSDGWYTASNGGTKIGDASQKKSISSNNTYYAQAKKSCDEDIEIEFKCSNKNACELSSDKKVLMIKSNTDLTFNFINDNDCKQNYRQVEGVLISGGSGGKPGIKTASGEGGDGGKIYKTNNIVIYSNSTKHTVTIGTGGESNQDGENTTIKCGSTNYTSANGTSVKYSTCYNNCTATTISFYGKSYGSYGNPGKSGRTGGKYDLLEHEQMPAVPTVGSSGDDNTGNGGNGGCGSVSGVHRMCGTGRCNSSNNERFNYPATAGGNGGSGIVILYNKKGWKQ